MSKEHEEIRKYCRDNDKRLEKLEKIIAEDIPKTLDVMETELSELKEEVKKNYEHQIMDYGKIKKNQIHIAELKEKINLPELRRDAYEDVKQEIAEIKKIISQFPYVSLDKFNELKEEIENWKRVNLERGRVNTKNSNMNRDVLRELINFLKSELWGDLQNLEEYYEQQEGFDRLLTRLAYNEKMDGDNERD